MSDMIYYKEHETIAILVSKLSFVLNTVCHSDSLVCGENKLRARVPFKSFNKLK